MNTGAVNAAATNSGIDRQEPANRPWWWAICSGAAALGVGALVYVVDRPEGATALPQNLAFFQPTVRLFGVLGQSLPSFVHVFAFSVLTTALLGASRRAAIAACAGWVLVNAAFEFGQYPAIAACLSQLTPAWFENIPILARAKGYFLYGTFDPMDLLFIALGALAAYLLMKRMQLWRTSHE